MSDTPKRTIFKALTLVQKDLSALGIGKTQTNDFDKYQFRGIDDVLNALSPILTRHGVIIVPDVIESELRATQTSNGKPSNHAKVTVEYHMYDGEGDGVVHKSVGEGMDRGDKSINKAVSSAYKTFAFQTFCIPLHGNDSEADSPESGHTEKGSTVRARDAAAILSELDRAGISAEAFCKKAGIPSLEALPQDRYGAALNWVKSLPSAEQQS